jgi:CBS domain-containing protein
MQAEPVTIGPEASLAELARLLRRHGISGVPVVAADGRAVGTVSITDLLWLSDRVRPTPNTVRTGIRWEGLDRVRVGDVMTPDVFGLAPTSSVEDLLEFFARTGLHRALVLEEGRAVGIVSITDLLALIAEEVEEPKSARKGER